MLRFKTPHLSLLLGLIAPLCSSAANYCIAVNGGFPGGTSFIGRDFAVPAKGNCTPWSGFTKTATTVVLFTSGTGCLSSNGKVLTVSVFNAQPSYQSFGTDFITLCPAGVSGCPLGEGTDQGENAGTAAPETCTTSLLNLPALPD